MGRTTGVKARLDQLRRRGPGAVLAFAILTLAACGGEGAREGITGPPPDEGVAPSAGCADGTLEHGALYRICFPADWNGDLVVYAHGYVSAGSAPRIPDDEVGGVKVATVVNDLRYAYATTSYRANGLVGPEAVEDLVDLEATVRRLYRPDPGKTLLVGPSEGGMVVTLAAERHPDLFDGALAACGPIGSLRRQLDYIGDFRVIFDYFFPGVIPGSTVDVPADVTARWEERYVPAVILAIVAKPAAARELVAITGAPVERNDLVAIGVTAVGLLWYHVFGTANAQQRLGGQPFDNSTRVYSGSSDDAALNAGVARFTADADALAAINQFETTGNLRIPVVTLHTTGDPIVPVEQQSLYASKVSQAGTGSMVGQHAIDRYGHCSFQAAELMAAFSDLRERVGEPAAILVAGADSD